MIDNRNLHLPDLPERQLYTQEVSDIRPYLKDLKLAIGGPVPENIGNILFGDNDPARGAKIEDLEDRIRIIEEIARSKDRTIVQRVVEIYDKPDDLNGVCVVSYVDDEGRNVSDFRITMRVKPNHSWLIEAKGPYDRFFSGSRSQNLIQDEGALLQTASQNEMVPKDVDYTLRFDSSSGELGSICNLGGEQTVDGDHFGRKVISSINQQVQFSPEFYSRL
jgi:hypothetical protein